MKNRIAIVALDLDSPDYREKSFSLLTAKEKIDVIFTNINNMCEQLKANEKEKKSMWVVAWHEYAIRELQKRYVSLDVKNYLQNKMCEITKEYPQLVVISGPIEVARPLNTVEKKGRTNAEKLARIKKRFVATTGPIYTVESKLVSEPKEVEKHLQQLDVVAKNLNTTGIFNKLKNFFKPKIKIISNTAYVFQGGKIVMKHRKVAPINETSKNTHVFSPGSKKTSQPVVTLKHHDGGEDVKIGIETCREHRFAHLKESSPEMPLIHVVVSNTIPMMLDNIHGNYAVPIDKFLKARLITKEESASHDVSLYDYKLRIESKMTLGAPIQPSTLEFKIVNSFKEEIKKYDLIIGQLSDLKKLPLSEAIVKLNQLQNRFPILNDLLESMPIIDPPKLFDFLYKVVDELDEQKKVVKRVVDDFSDKLSEKNFTRMISSDVYIQELIYSCESTRKFPQAFSTEIQVLVKAHKDISPPFNSKQTAPSLEEKYAEQKRKIISKEPPVVEVSKGDEQSFQIKNLKLK